MPSPDASQSPTLDRVFTAMRWTAAVVCVGVGVWTIDRESKVWAAVTILLYGAPAIFQLMRPRLRALGAWLAVFLVGQTLLSVAPSRRNFLTLAPNMHLEVDVQAGFAGIEGLQTITTDARGFRVTRPIDYRHKAGSRIFAIGGSTTEQIYLDDHRTWTHLLQEELSHRWKEPVEVINTGVAGLRAIHHLATLQQIAGDDPDLVVFMVGLNDWNAQIIEAFAAQHGKQQADPESVRRWRYLRESLLGRAINSLRPRPATAGAARSRVDRGEYYAGQRRSLERRIKESFHPDAVSTEYSLALERIASTCERGGIRCMLVTQPSAYQPGASEDVRALFWMTPPNQAYTLDFESIVAIANLYNQHLRRLAEERHLPLCDAAAAMEPTVDNFYDDCHLNTSGARHFARMLTACVESALPRP